MITSDDGDLGSAPALDLAREIERFANQLFAGGSPAVTPNHALPSALAVGAGGASPAVTAPPIPGALHRPPLAATPMPKESDLRNLPAMFADPLGTTPIALAREPSSHSPSASTPYFLDLAGLPGVAVPVTSAPPGSFPAYAPTAPDFLGVPVAAPRAAPPHAVAPASATEVPASGDPTAFLPAYEFQPELVPQVTSSGGAFDAASVKRDFPILQERVHGRPLVWLDSAATTQKPQAVIDRVSYFYEHENSNVHRAAHALAARATDAYEAARDKVRRFLGAPSAKEIVFVRGATEAINLVAQSWGRRHVQAGDEIVITWLEHHANIVPWQQLCSEKGARLRVAPVDSRGQVNLEEYEKLLGPKTRLVSITQVSNALGTVVPVQAMTETAQRYGAKVHIDGAQAVSHMPVDVQALGCDFYSFSGHKVFGPTGIGVLFGRAEVLEAMPPWQGGGNMIADVTFEKTTYQSAPARFEAGTGNIADAVGLGAALDYVSALGMENVRRYEHELLEYAEAGLARVPGLHMIGTAAEKAGVMSFVLDGMRTEDVGAALDQEGIALRSGHHCAQPILRRFGVESTVRASLAIYNTKDDIDALVAALLRLRAGQPLTRG
jgi:cysteine desulfurase/selenocysteine lyase